MTDNYAEGAGGRTSVVTLRDEEMSNSRRRRRSDYDDYSEDCYDEDDQDDDDDEQDGSCCQCMRCPAQIFSSVLLGLLACVLVTGGVFLAFHKWDHTWLLVSAIGIILMAIGTAMHCCSSQNSRKSGGPHRCKGGCTSGVNGGVRNHHHPNHHKGNQIINNGNVLAEQLLPLSNARSVSQLSLNMVPGYFPPLVYSTNGTSYGLEQHSAVVQNISRLVQHQTQLHLQHPGTATQPTVDGAKGFILVPLPAQGANAASIQNIMAAVSQLDVSNAIPDHGRDVLTTDVSSQATQSSFVLTENNHTAPTISQQPPLAASSIQPSLKHVEVQTCSNDWNILNQQPIELKPATNTPVDNVPTVVDDRLAVLAPATAELSCQTSQTELLPPSGSSESNNSTTGDIATSETSHEQCQTDDMPVLETIIVPLTETSCNSTACDTSLVNDDTPNPILVPEEPISVTGNIPAEAVTVENCQVTDIHSVELLQQACSSGVVSNYNEVVHSVELCQPSACLEDANDEFSSNERVDDTFRSTNNSSEGANMSNVTTSDTVPSGTSINLVEEVSTSDILASSDSSIVDESEFLDRSSPPPSYEDVTHETSASGGVFGTAYGTM